MITEQLSALASTLASPACWTTTTVCWPGAREKESRKRGVSGAFPLREIKHTRIIHTRAHPRARGPRPHLRPVLRAERPWFFGERVEGKSLLGC